MPEFVPVITIDGPSGVGKGTLAKDLSRKLGWHYMDSGLLYRLLALQFLVHKDLTKLDYEALKKQAKIQLDSGQIDPKIRSEECALIASQIAKEPQVRTGLLEVQLGWRILPGLVCDGRDMGRIFTDAIVKIFLTASIEARAQRRAKQLAKLGQVDFEQILAEMQQRDFADCTRTLAPLVKSLDAIEINNENLNQDEVLVAVMKLVKPKLAQLN